MPCLPDTESRMTHVRYRSIHGYDEAGTLKFCAAAKERGEVHIPSGVRVVIVVAGEE